MMHQITVQFQTSTGQITAFNNKPIPIKEAVKAYHKYKILKIFIKHHTTLKNGKQITINNFITITIGLQVPGLIETDTGSIYVASL